MSFRLFRQTALCSATAAALAFAAPLAVCAQEATYRFDIPAQELGAALRAFAQASRQQITFDNVVAQGRTSVALEGRYTVDEGLRRLLGGSGLELRRTQNGVLYVVDPIALPVTESGAAPDDGAAQAPQTPTGEVVQEFETIVVTGSNIRGAVNAGSNLIMLGSEDIERSGYGSVAQFMQTLPQNFAGNASEQSQAICCGGGSNQTFGTAVDLRGLGGDTTLTLVDGRRLAPAGIGTFTDVSMIPAGAVERVEILADGASATYGSDAVAGVVNFVLKKAVDAPETTFRYAPARGGGEEWSLGQLFGGEWSSGHLILAYEHYEKQPLPASARRATRSADLRDRGGGDYRTTIANPGTITAIGGQPVVFGIPAGQDGRTLREEDLLPGQFNLGDQQQGTNVLPGQKRDSVFATLRQRLGERADAYATVLWSRRRFENDNERTGGTPLTVPESNAFRQLNGLFAGQGPLTVAYDLGEDFGPARQTGEAESASLQAGTQWWLGATWQLDAFVTWARQTDSGERSITDFGALGAALASSDPATAFNPFGDGSHTDPAVLAGLRGHAENRAETEVRSGQVKADGEVLQLPGGMLKLAVGAERRKETFEYHDVEFGADGAVLNDFSPLFPPRDRSVTALFVEAAVPIVGADNRRTGLHALDLSLSARYEDYSDAGDTLNPKVGLRWQPAESLTLRGTWGTSFKAPFFSDIGRPQQGFIVDFPQAIDPEATDGATSTLLLIGGNRDLKPERSRNWTAGFDYAPAWAPRTRLSLTYFDIHFTDRVQAIGNVLGPFLEPEIYRSVFVRNPTQEQVDAYLADIDEFLGLPPAPGSVEAIIDARQANIAVIDLSGFDLGLSRTAQVRGGDLTLDLNASYLTRYDARIAPGAPEESRLNRVGNPVDLRFRAGASYGRGPFRGSVFVNYVDEYANPQSSLAPDVDAFVTVDVSSSVDLGALFGRGFGGLTASAAVLNLFDEPPPFVDNREGVGFDPANASALGRLVSFTLRKQW